MNACVPILCRGEQLLLHPERAVLWPRRQTVIVADTHFGKSGFFARHGIAVPAGCDAGDRVRLESLVAASAARRLIVLGDFVHALLAADSDDNLELRAWIARLADSVDIEIIAGNHDVGTARTPFAGLQWHTTPLEYSPFRFLHDADGGAEEAAARPFTLSGHVHPVVRLGRGSKSGLRVPAFWLKPDGLILPSFGSFTGGFAVRAGTGERLFAAGPSGVVPVG